VLDGDPAPPKKGAQQRPPIFGPCLLWPDGWMDQDATWYGGRSRPRPHYVRCGPRSPGKGAQRPPLFGPCLSWPNGRRSQLLLSSCYYTCELKTVLWDFDHIVHSSAIFKATPDLKSLRQNLNHAVETTDQCLILRVDLDS